MSFLQGLFGQAPAGSYRWSLDSEQSEITIRDESPIHVDKVAQRPAINLTMGTVSFYSLGMDDMYSYDVSIDRKVKVALIPGTVSINCCSRVDIECHDLAWIIAEHIWLLRELLLQKGFFEVGRGIQISPPSPAGSIVVGDGADEWFCSSISVPYQFGRKSAFTKLGQSIANNIKLSLETQLSQGNAGGGPPALAEPEYSVRVDSKFPPSFAPGASDTDNATPDPAGTRTPSLPLVPHPLNPAKLVYIQTVRPARPVAFRRSALFP